MDSSFVPGIHPPPMESWHRAVELKAVTDGLGLQGNNSAAYINELRFAASKSIRTSYIILASFNAVAGAATALGIYWDCYFKAKRKDPYFSLRSSFWRVVGPAEMFPFVMSLGIMVQGIIFAAIQSFGLHGHLILGCEPLSQVMFPAFFIVPYIQFTFGLEATIQALRSSHPFSPRHKWSIPTCLAGTFLALIATYVVTRVDLPANFCLPSLVFLLQRWSIACFGLIIGIVATLLIGSLSSFYRLYHVLGVGERERITATWMAWFMAWGALTLSIMAPFFHTVAATDAFSTTTMLWELSMVTGVVSNLTGLMTGGMYVLLRSSKMGKLGPKGYYEFESQRSARRPNSSVPHSFIFTRQMEQPVPLPTQLSPAKGPTRSIHTTQDVELGLEPTDEFASGEPRMAGSVPGESVIGVATTTPVVIPSQEPTRPRKNSAYSLFSRETSTFDANSASLLPATAYTPSNKDQLPNPFDDDPFLSPPTIRFSGRRTRELSFGSSATVPIGIRVSNINDMAPIQSFYEVPPFPRAVCSDGTVSGVPVPPVPDTLAVPDETAAKEAKDKQLPPVPLSLMKEGQSVKMADEEVRLSPTVYTPPQRTPRKGRDKVTSPTSPSPGPRHNSEGYPPVDEAEWI